jgi:hypothetical protein
MILIKFLRLPTILVDMASKNTENLIQGLKGFGSSPDQGLVIPVHKTAYHLVPVNCHPDTLSMAVVNFLTSGRNANKTQFLTQFDATPKRTYEWLTSVVGPDSGRILFVLKNSDDQTLYGYLGLGYCDHSRSYIEADSIVRCATVKVDGLMKASLTELLNWSIQYLGFEHIWVRVLSTNPAVNFYNKRGFEISHSKPLFKKIFEADMSIALNEVQEDSSWHQVDTQLIYMKFQKPVDEIRKFIS